MSFVFAFLASECENTCKGKLVCSRSSYSLRSDAGISDVIGCSNRLKIVETSTRATEVDETALKNKKDAKPRLDDPKDEEGMFFVFLN